MAVKKDRELTNKEKAQYILENGFSSKSQSTLERMSKEELDLIIKLQRDLDKDEVNKEDREATAGLINNIMDFLNSWKKERSGKEINPALRGFISKNTQDLSLVNTKISGVIGIVLIGLAGVYVFLDSIVGIDKVKEFILSKKKSTQTKEQGNK